MRAFSPARRRSSCSRCSPCFSADAKQVEAVAWSCVTEGVPLSHPAPSRAVPHSDPAVASPGARGQSLPGHAALVPPAASKADAASTCPRQEEKLRFRGGRKISSGGQLQAQARFPVAGPPSPPGVDPSGFVSENGSLGQRCHRPTLLRSELGRASDPQPHPPRGVSLSQLTARNGSGVPWAPGLRASDFHCPHHHL